jgi:hypothetical protein
VFVPAQGRSASFGLADLYPESKGPVPSTYQLANPHEAAAASRVQANVLNGPPLNARELLDSPATWVIVAVVALLALGMRKG